MLFDKAKPKKERGFYMKNYMKKTIPLLLVLLLLLPMAAACKNKNPSGSGTTEPDTLAEKNDLGLPARDLGGVDYKILDANDKPELHVNYSESNSGSAVEKVLFERDAYVEKAFNVILRYEQIDNVDNKAISAFTNSYNAGDHLCDMIVSTLSGGRLTTLACNGYLADLASLPNMTLDENWWSSQMYEQMSLGGKMYFSTGDIMASVYDAPMVMYANKTLLARYNITDNLYDKVNDGTWTIEYLTTLVKDTDQDLNSDNQMSVNDDFYGFATQPLRLTVQGMLVGMDYTLSSVIDETILIDLDTDITSYLDLIKGAVSPITINWDAGQSTDDVINKVFKNDRAIFLCHLIEAATHNLNDMVSDYTILPMPKGSVEQTSYHSLINGWVNCFVGVPYFADNGEYAELAGFVLEALARTSYYIVRPVAFDEIVMYQSIREPESMKMLDIIYNTLYLDFHAVYDFGGWGTEVANYVYKNKAISSTLTGLRGTILADAQDIADQWLNPRGDKESKE